VIVPRSAVSLRDLAALTAHTGLEYAMFTLGGQRLVFMGIRDEIPAVTIARARALNAEGWRFSGHTHPGVTALGLTASKGDQVILQQFINQQLSVIVNSVGEFRLFNKEVVKDLSNWLPGAR
jgi:hypothetical protein